MIKVYQTIVDKGNGNCMQATIASLFELELDEVPHFLLEENEGVFGMLKFLLNRGYDPCYINRREEYDTEFMKKIAKFDGGVNGYFYASVPSQTFSDVSHAVVVDSDLNIVHDPNPNQLALKLTPDDVNGIYTMNDMVIGKTGKLFKKVDWENASEEEREMNTYKVSH